jgi:hypothetical protein
VTGTPRDLRDAIDGTPVVIMVTGYAKARGELDLGDAAWT